MRQVTLDCMHEACPIPLLKAERELRKMRIGDVLILQTDHSCSIANVLDWCKKKGHGVDYVQLTEGEWEIYIEKRA